MQTSETLPGTSLGRNPAVILDSNNHRDLVEAALRMKRGEIGALPFNGIYGLFGDVDNPNSTDLIITAKNRPEDKKLIIVPSVDHLEEIANLSLTPFDPGRIRRLLRNIHALGVIFPAAESAPPHLVKRGKIDTVLTIWTQYDPMINILDSFRQLGGRALVGTSANKSSAGTHFSFKPLYDEFCDDLHFAMSGNFDHLSPSRRKSTTVIDLTGTVPRLHRAGNVSNEELREALLSSGLPDFVHGDDVIQVKAR